MEVLTPEEEAARREAYIRQVRANNERLRGLISECEAEIANIDSLNGILNGIHENYFSPCVRELEQAADVASHGLTIDGKPVVSNVITNVKNDVSNSGSIFEKIFSDLSNRKSELSKLIEEYRSQIVEI